MEAALDLIAERGEEGVTLRELTDAAPILDEAAAALDRAGQLLSAHLAGAERVTA